MGPGLSWLSSGTTLKHRLQVNLGILKRRGAAAVTEPQDGLSIGELARRTEVPAATLRSWENRYGFPRPHRLAGGHRRYDQADIALIEAVVRLRAAGMSLRAAIGQATAAAGHPEPSVFAACAAATPDSSPRSCARPRCWP